MNSPSNAENCRKGAGDLFIVRLADAMWHVSRFMARSIEAELLRRSKPRWITLVDLGGSRIRVRSSKIVYLQESTFEQRAARRQLQQALKDEECTQAGGWAD